MVAKTLENVTILIQQTLLGNVIDKPENIQLISSHSHSKN